MTKRLALSSVLVGVMLAGVGCEGPAGTPCTVASNGDGTSTVSCPDGTKVTIKNGTNGTQGTNGQSGTSCTVTDNGDGTKTVSCTDGTSVTVSDGTGSNGSNGTNGLNGTNGMDARIENFHGTSHLEDEEFRSFGKFITVTEISSATADAAGKVTVQFTVKDKDNNPVTNLASASADIAYLEPSVSGSPSYWVAYIYRKEEIVAPGAAPKDWPNPAGTKRDQPTSESSVASASNPTPGTLTHNGGGAYTYVFGRTLGTTTKPVAGTTIAYDATVRAKTHRVSIMHGGHDGPTGTATFDFVPAGGAVTEKRNIVQTQYCKSCHNEEFHGHGGNRITVENCMTCHTQGSEDANSGESIDGKVMFHKMHAGAELKSIAGADGIVWDNPATAVNEAADNGKNGDGKMYAIWGNASSKHTWWKAEFPAIIENCEKCHQGTGEQVDNWKTKPSRAACGSCHDDVDFAGGVNHLTMNTDAGCFACHPSSGAVNTGANVYPVPAVHDWTKTYEWKTGADLDERNHPEFEAEVTMSPPGNGTHYVAGEAPKVYIKLKDLETGGTPYLDLTTMPQASAVGCVTGAACPPRPASNGFATAALMVHGPRATRNPVLTLKSYAKVYSGGVGPYDLSGGSSALTIKFDGGEDIPDNAATGTPAKAGTVSIPITGGTAPIPTPAAATVDDMVAWLNGHYLFNRRGVAYKVDATNDGNPANHGKLAIRSRNLGRLFAVQLVHVPVSGANIGSTKFTSTTADLTKVFSNDTAAKVPGSSSVSFYQPTTATNQDPRVTYGDPDANTISYQLDPVDDLAAGTYLATVEIAARGRVDGVNYKTPTVFKRPFQVKTATEEKLPANNCQSCHQGPDGRGFVLDFARHYKIFDDTALDQCGGCHDYQPQNATGEWSSGHPIAKRVHAVHNGAALNFPLATVAYSGGDPIAGRDWDITLPQDVRNCDTTCHSPTSSGTWKTKPSRLPCLGCHDSLAAQGHIKSMTYDPTPADPWSGDEREACQTCH